MIKFHEFLTRLGNLHDCTVISLKWRPKEHILYFEIEDIFFNFEGLPEYPGPLVGEIILEGVLRLDVSLTGMDKSLRINDFCIVKEMSNEATASITFWPSGKIEVTYRKSMFPKTALSQMNL